MDHKLLTDLPSEILITILYRLPPKTIISCKCVCKSLLHLLETPDFVKFHLSKSIPDLIICDSSKVVRHPFKIFQFQDQLNLENHDLRYVPVAEFNCGASINTPRLSELTMEGSANGLLLLRNQRIMPNPLYICNPITREYINLSNIPNPKLSFFNPRPITYGFGVTKKTDQYKVVKIFHEIEIDPRTCSSTSILRSEYHVYTLGTGTWRSVPNNSSLKYYYCSEGTFLNGKLYWVVSDLEGLVLISCFDLETELFKVFPLPCDQRHRYVLHRYSLGVVEVFGDSLCLCDNTSNKKVVIWVMKDYGVEEFWAKEFVIKKLPDPLSGLNVDVYPIKIFGDGDMLLSWGRIKLVHYSNKTNTTSNVEMFEQKRSGRLEARLHVSSFLSLKTFAIENVTTF